eukprot:scaffold296524_cov36-Prasinocladus_malaysianus.AAC.1
MAVVSSNPGSPQAVPIVGNTPAAACLSSVRESIQLDFSNADAGSVNLSLDLAGDDDQTEEKLRALERSLTPEPTRASEDISDVDLDEAVEMAELLAAQFEASVTTDDPDSSRRQADDGGSDALPQNLDSQGQDYSEKVEIAEERATRLVELVDEQVVASANAISSPCQEVQEPEE